MCDFLFKIDSEDDNKLPGTSGDIDLSKTIPKGTDKGVPFLQDALSSLPEKWRNWVIRGIFTWLMLGGFCLLIYGGPSALMIAVSSNNLADCLHLNCYSELFLTF